MKYIRTEDGVFRIDNDKISIINGCQFASIRGGILHCLDIEDKVADTIEELCNEFVVVIDKEPNGYLIFNQCMSSFEKVISIHKNTKNENTIYGAIWTDKGLIYVAKMNDKGELELL